MTDTTGTSDMIFGLFWLLGYQFSPRLADAGEAIFWRIGKEDPDEEGESVVKEQQHDGRKYRAVRGLPERGTF